jgi:hypothetical protein
MIVESNGGSAKRRRGSAGGRAAEGGSTYRAGFAAYLAAHGLADTTLRIGSGVEPGIPVLLWLETSSAVDDMRCLFNTDCKWDVQAKRTCNWGQSFDNVVKQWVTAAREEQLSKSDRLVLASGQISKPLKDLGASFHRLRERVGGELLPGEQNAIKRFQDQASRDNWLDVFDLVVAHALVIELSAETEQDASFMTAAALLDGTVVARDSGAAAVNVLARFFQVSAKRSGASDPEEWINVLNRVGVPAGPVSTMSTAGRARAVAAYRQRLVKRRDLLEVDHLAMGIAPLPVPDLLQTFRIELPLTQKSNRSTASLADVARRWAKFAVVGLPGSGKSTALEQLAAGWASDLEAPLPIMVRLQNLVSRLRSRQVIELEDLCRLADEANEQIVPVLVERLAEGSAALLLDGLDECRDQQGGAVTLVRELATQLGRETGLVVTAREAASELICRTGLPVTVLEEPSNLESRVQHLVDHITELVSPQCNKAEVSRRRQWVKRSQSLHPSIWRIPLFAMLLAVHAATTRTGSLPATRADVLVTAIKDCVRRWEGQKEHQPNAWNPELHPNMLLDEFSVIGHVIVDGPTDDRVVNECITRDLMSAWDLPLARARAVAGDIMNWWIDRVGVFIKIGDSVVARVTLMAEVADAMWVVRQALDVRSEWVARVISDPIRYREPAMLAAGLDREMICQFIDAAREPETLLWVSDAVFQSATPDDRAVEILVDGLVEVVTQPVVVSPRSERGEETKARHLFRRLNDRQERIDGPVWPYVLRLVRLPLVPSSRQKRDAALNLLTDMEQSVVARVLAIVSDCAFDRRAPTESERSLLNDVFALPLPEQKVNRVERRSRRRVYVAGNPILLGRAEAVTGAIRLTGLTEENAQAVARLLSKTSINSSQELIDAMTEAGFGELATTTIGFERVFAPIRSWLSESAYRDLRFVLKEASKVPNANIGLHKTAALWRLTGAATLIKTLRLGEQNLYAGLDAVDDFPELVRHIVRLAISATGLSNEVVADDCQRALELMNTKPLETSVLLHVSPDPLRPASPSVPLVTSEDNNILGECLKSHNDWLFTLAAQWLTEQPTADQLTILWDALPHVAPPHRFGLACWLFATAGNDNIYQQFLDGNDNILRLASARIIGEIGTSESLMNLLIRDTDLMIRLQMLRGLKKEGHSSQLHKYAQLAINDTHDVWTCKLCGAVESIAQWDCSNCTIGSRPDLNEEIQKLLKQTSCEYD